MNDGINVSAFFLFTLREKICQNVMLRNRFDMNVYLHAGMEQTWTISMKIALGTLRIWCICADIFTNSCFSTLIVRGIKINNGFDL